MAHKRYSMTLVGDLIINDAIFPSLAYHNTDNSFFQKELLDEVCRSDVFFANFEGVISERGGTAPQMRPKEFSFCSLPKIVSFFKQFKRCIFSLANNHIFDYGPEAFLDTIMALTRNKIDYSGAGRTILDALTPRVISLGDMRISFLAFTDLLPDSYYASSNHMGVAKLTDYYLKEAIRQAKNMSDFVVVSLHTIADVYASFSFWPDHHQKEFSRLAIDYGANLVVGHQPHGLQFFEKYHTGLIFYSLGAFVYDPKISSLLSRTSPFFDAAQVSGGAVLTIQFSRNGVHDVRVLPTRVTYGLSGRPRLVSGPFFLKFAAKIMSLATKL